MVLGLIRVIPRWSLGHRLAEAALIGAGFATIALPVVTLLVGCLLIALGAGGTGDDAGVMTLVFCQMLFLTGWLGLLRRCDFRLVLGEKVESER